MKPLRLFIAINLPDSAKESLLEFTSRWPELPARWVKKENLHLTLIFIGYTQETHIPEICNIIKQVAKHNSSFNLKVTKIVYAPPKTLPPKMIWAMVEKSNELDKLQKDLEASLSNSNNIPFSPEKRPFSPHITLARIKTWSWRQIDPEERPEVDEMVNINFKVSSIELMESKLKKEGAEYTILESFKLLE